MWNDLSMADKAKYIKLAVQNKVTSLSDIIDTYNVYANGGNTENNIPNTEDTKPGFFENLASSTSELYNKTKFLSSG